MTTRRISASFGDTLRSIVEYLAGTAGYAAAAIALVLFFHAAAHRGARAMAGSPRDERRTRRDAVLDAAAAADRARADQEHRLLSLWNTPALNLLPVMLLGSPLVTVPRAAVLRIAQVMTAITL